MGSTPLNQSENEPRLDTEPAAAAFKSGDGPGRPIGDHEPEAVPSNKAADAADEAKDDTQELSREEVAALISTDNEARDDADETDRSIPAVEDDTNTETVASHAETSPESSVPTRSADLIRFGLWSAGIVVLLVLSAAFGLSYLNNRPAVGSLVKKQPAADARLKTSSSGDSRAAADSTSKDAPDIQTPANALFLRFKAKQDQIDVLRDKMLGKAAVIANLRHHYREGIRQVEAAVLMGKRQAGIHSLQQAIKTKRIAFQLETIRRRQAYIDCLAKPADWLLQGSEELLFLKRKHFLQSLIFPVSSQIDPEKMAAEKEAAFDRYSNSAVALTVDLEKAPYQTVDQTWQNLLEREKRFTSSRLPTAQDTQRSSGGSFQVNNQSIWREICQGRYNRKSDLTALSIEAADCLAGWKEPDLFLNGIKELSPEAARRLFKWNGSWFCLNGLTDLPPETAEYLFRWNGDWLSLNGVKHLSFESSIFLTGWKGRTLELMGLSPESMELEALALKHLAQWQRSGGKLFVPERIRQLIDSAS